MSSLALPSTSPFAPPAPADAELLTFDTAPLFASLATPDTVSHLLETVAIQSRALDLVLRAVELDAGTLPSDVVDALRAALSRPLA